MRPGNRNGFPSDGTPLKRAKLITRPVSGARYSCAFSPQPPRKGQVATPGDCGRHASRQTRADPDRLSALLFVCGEEREASIRVLFSRTSSVVRFYYSARFRDANQPPLFTLKIVKRFKHADDLSVFHSVGRVFFSARTTRECSVGARCIYAFCEICLKYSGLVCRRVLPRQKDTQGAGRRCGSPLFVPVAEDGGLELTWDSGSAFPLRARARASR